MTTKNRFFFLSVLLIVVLSVIPVYGQKKALFIGNSYTAGMPDIIEDIAESAGDELYTSHYWGAQTLEEVSGLSDVYDDIRSDDWDYVNIQEQSIRSHAEPSQFEINSLPYARILVDSINEYVPCAQPVFYMVWAYRNGPLDNYPNEAYYAQQLNDSINYQNCAYTLSGICAPVGEAWKQASYDKPWLVLHDNDESHPTIFGMYLTALVYYVTFFEKSPEGLFHPDAIPDSTAEYLQQLAATVVLDQKNEWRIGIDAPNNPPELLSPKNEILDANLSVNIAWAYVSGAEHYDLEIATDELFTQTVFSQHSIAANNSTVELEEYGTKYYYRVRAGYTLNSADCKSYWSKPNYFYIPYAGPALISPIHEDECVPLKGKLSWEIKEIGDTYLIQIAMDEHFENIIVEEKDLYSVEFNYTLDEELTDYFWRVQVWEGAVTKKWSEPWKFTTNYAAPKPIAPEQGDINVWIDRVEFSWECSYDDTEYRLQISYDSIFSDIFIDMDGISAKSVKIDLKEYYAIHYWRVSFVRYGCQSEWSDPISFRTELPRPKPTSPENAVTDIEPPITFEWDFSPDNILFELLISDTPDFEEQIVRKLNIFEKNSVISILESGKLFYWKVRAYTPTEHSRWSEVFNFSTKGAVPGAPVLISPENSSIKIAPDTVLRWNSVKGVQTYLVQIAEDDSFTESLGESGPISDTVYSVSGLDHNKTYFWRVKAENNAGSPWSEVWSFRIIAAKIENAPGLLSPADGADMLNAQIEFSWNEVEYAENYHLQISKSYDFEGELVFENDMIVNIKFETEIFQPETEYFWRLRGSNEAGPGPWSNIYSFTTDKFTGVEERILRNKNMKIYPNPSTGLINILCDDINPQKIIIRTLEGKILKKIEISEAANIEISIDLGSLARGVYFVEAIGKTRNLSGYIILE